MSLENCLEDLIWKKKWTARELPRLIILEIENRTCTWNHESGTSDGYKTNCGRFYDIEGCSDNEFKYCPGCGRRIKFK